MSQVVRIDLSPLHNLGKGGIANSQLVDGKHTVIRCSVCNKSLCDIWVTQPAFKMNTKLTAHCGYCGDKSFESTIQGKFQTGETDDSGLLDVKNEFLDTPPDGAGIYQIQKVFTKRKK